MGYNTKNYTEQGGEKTVIGGILEVKEGGSLEIKEGALLKGFPIASNQANSTAATVNDLKDNFNDLLAKLKDAGFMGFDTWNLSVAKAPITTEGEADNRESK
ncbi:MAG: Head fiber protein [Candidatus Syntrophopropionicum ammoniitolerans]